MARGSMPRQVISKVNARPKFLHRKTKYLTPNLSCLLCNALIQPHFDFAFSVWFPNLSLQNKIQTSQNKCICSCLKLDKMAHVSQKRT